ncbi:glutamate 5-kinase [Weissella paramesenteroides]|nr:glutamate 5-kinase [Weissella paramesenteroides]KAA8458742.1 glutamate 5-kinase [Weissella paramesenteroides]KAA8459284.1 glutamate 5-kinase [Weissella paramesenteroides]KAA8463282.1 glutamate 5-kinase [Weissella paramesenteroides]KAA8463880.1 glutamate 5-kinase [Weissella paramesenteroides]
MIKLIGKWRAIAMKSNRHMENVSRIVVKIGTSSLMHGNGKLNLQAIDQLSYTLTGLVNEGKQVILVSSGAIGAGMGQLGLTERPEQIQKQQALASIGQSELMTVYQQRFAAYGQRISQVLLTHDVLDYPQSREYVHNTMEQLLDWGVIPVVNENDTVAVDELDHRTTFGDNDKLSAIVAVRSHADLLIMLSDIDGFYTGNPHKDPQAKLIKELHQVTADSLKRAGGAGTVFGTGGMATKLTAAADILKHKQMMVLANGANPSIIFNIMNGEEVGTLFISEENSEESNDDRVVK